MIFIKLSFAGGLILFLIAWSVAYINLADVNELLVIHFDYFKGANFFGTKQTVFAVLAVGLLILLVNFFLSRVFYFRERSLAYVFAGVSFFAALLILAQIIVIMNTNL